MSGADSSRLRALAALARGEAQPAALLDLDALRRNATKLALAGAPLPIRLASKSIRARGVLRRVLAEFPAFRGILAFSAREAVFLADDGFDDLVVAYPTVLEAEVAEVATRVRRGARITLAVDSIDHVARCARVARDVGVRLPLCLDLDAATHFPGLRFGVKRSPLHGVDDALAVVAAIEASDTVYLDGMLAYEAQIAGIRDHVPGQEAKMAAMRAMKRVSMREVAARRKRVVDAVRARVPLRFVNGGGTGSLAISKQDGSIDELAAGSGLFAPGLFDGYAGLPLEPALIFSLSVSRVHDERTVVCSGGGYVASGPGGPDRLPTPVYPEGGALLGHEGAGEVQTPVEYPIGARPGLGDVVLFRHAKSGELAERMTEYVVVEGERVVERMPTYRGDGACFF